MLTAYNVTGIIGMTTMQVTKQLVLLVMDYLTDEKQVPYVLHVDSMFRMSYEVLKMLHLPRHKLEVRVE
jgi:hypothetical protein